VKAQWKRKCSPVAIVFLTASLPSKSTCIFFSLTPFFFFFLTLSPGNFIKSNSF